MQTFLRRRSAMTAYSLFVACLLLLVTSPAPTAAQSSSCARMKVWAATYVTTHAVPTLEELAPLNRGERVAVFNQIAPEVRADLWREQLRRFAARTDITAEQRSFILAQRERLNADAYRPGADRDKRRAQLKAFWATAAPLFTSREHQRMWFDIGAVVITPRASFATLAQDPPLCECSGIWAHIECFQRGSCDSDDCHVYVGCGPQMMFLCEGMCEDSSATNATEP